MAANRTLLKERDCVNKLYENRMERFCFHVVPNDTQLYFQKGFLDK